MTKQKFLIDKNEICLLSIHFSSVIYVIVDTNTPPVFTNYSSVEVYDPVSASQDGRVSLGGVPAGSIRIRAVLGPSYFSGQNDYFEFTLGDGKLTDYNGLTVTNSPLDSSTSNHISYYILFKDENGVSESKYTFLNRLIEIYIFSFSANFTFSGSH